MNCVAPGLTRTDLARALARNEAVEKASVSLDPLARVGEPAEGASAIGWLSSPEQAWGTGQGIGVDRGLASVQAKS